VIGADRRPAKPVERYLAWLTRIERSPNTVRAYAEDLKTFWVFLEGRGLRWDQLTLEQVGLFTGWLRQPARPIRFVRVLAPLHLVGPPLAHCRARVGLSWHHPPRGVTWVAPQLDVEVCCHGRGGALRDAAVSAVCRAR